MFEYISWLISTFHLIGMFMIDTRNKCSFFPGSLSYSRVIHGNILKNKKEDDMELYYDTIKQWALSKITKTTISHHWWYDKLPDNIQSMFEKISNSSNIYSMFSEVFDPFYYTIEPIYEMNEIYVTGQERKDESIQSDRVFFISHIDGPFMWVPFVSVYRCLIGINENEKITTHFPVLNTCYKVNKGDALAFDFNREVHYISEKNVPDSEPRVTLKAHYCIYPKYLKWLGNFMYVCNSVYDNIFRNLFLKTIEPENILDRINGFIVVYSTHLFMMIETWIGYRNIYYIVYITYWYSIDPNKSSFYLYFPCFYKHVSLVLFYHEQHMIEQTSNIRDMIIFLLAGFFSLYYYNIQ